MKIVIIYLNAIITTIVLLAYISVFLDENFILPAIEIVLATYKWFSIAWVVAIIQTIYGISRYKKDKKTFFLHHIYAGCFVGSSYLFLLILLKLGFFLMA